MAEYKLFEDDIPHVSTAAFHEHRERAPHLEQPAHKARLIQAADFVREAALDASKQVTVSDLGCGDGGLLSLISPMPAVSSCWGYDFQPSNKKGWRDRGVTAYLQDAFGPNKHNLQYGSVSITTEVLEHLANPHRAVHFLSGRSSYLIASSPYDEHAGSHDECHAWAWDMEGYKAMIEANGFTVIRHVAIDKKFQVLLARATRL